MPDNTAIEVVGQSPDAVCTAINRILTCQKPSDAWPQILTTPSTNLAGSLQEVRSRGTDVKQVSSSGCGLGIVIGNCMN